MIKRDNKSNGQKMAELKTKENDQDVNAYIDSVEDPVKREDCKTTLAIMEEITGKKAKMWGDSIIGFGRYHYKYKSGREGDWLVTGFAPRKQNFTIYIMPGFSSLQKKLGKLGKHKTSVSCLYIKKLEVVDLDILKTIIQKSVKEMNKLYDCS